MSFSFQGTCVLPLGCNHSLLTAIYGTIVGLNLRKNRNSGGIGIMVSSAFQLTNPQEGGGEAVIGLHDYIVLFR